MRSWKQRWKAELDAKMPDMAEFVKRTPLPQTQTETSCISKRKFSWRAFWTDTVWENIKRYRRHWTAIAATGMAAVLALCIFLPSLFAVTPVNATTSVWSIEINPQAFFSVDENGIVTAVVAGNADADVLLSSAERKESLIGQSVGNASVLFVDYAAQLGFLALDGTGAVKVSACGEKEKLQNVGEQMRTYLSEKGVFAAVVEEQATKTEFAQYLENAALTLQGEWYDVLSGGESAYGARIAQGKNTEEVQALYEEIVPLEQIKEIYKAQLKNNIERIEKNIDDLQRIYDLNETIKDHDENPREKWHLWTKDYWSVKENCSADTYTSSFATVMQEMEAALSAYDKEYGVSIDSSSALMSEQGRIGVESVQDLLVWLENFTADLLAERIVYFTDLLSSVGIDMTWAKELYEKPLTMTEYLQKIDRYNQQKFAWLEGANAAEYGKDRAALSKAEYQEKETAIVSQYGSLTAYWENLKK